MKIGIIGSRRRNSSNDKNILEYSILKFISNLKDQTNISLVSGGCSKGGDLFAEQIAKEYNIPIQIFYPDKSKLDTMQKLKGAFANLLLGDRTGLTIIGPASIVKKIEKNPDKIELFTNEINGSSRYRGKTRRRR